ncbi:MAG TPA: DUF1569 domain-containing protein [Puia sp.]|nr:DUF1569 domain-containing protein [Puia sp.]
MKNLFNASDVQELKNRINQLSSTAKRQWGKMEPAQMLAHCCVPLELATGKKSSPRSLLGRILGPLAKPRFVGPKPFPKNSPTDKNFIITGQRDFDAEKKRLLQLIDEFFAGGEAGCTQHPHPFFGKLTPQQWASSQYKHLDHHMTQFGV